MRVIAVRLSTDEQIRRACQFTLHSQNHTKISIDKLYDCEHSPIRVDRYWIECYDIPTFVVTHFVRHHVGIEKFVQTMRDDRGADYMADRNTPINFAMELNAQALMNIARLRLCLGSHPETVTFMNMIKAEIRKVNPTLGKHLMPKCKYRGGVCHEHKSCGISPHVSTLS